MPELMIQTRLTQMREEYTVWLHQELIQLAAAARMLPPDSHDPDPWRMMRDRLHKIAGGAGTFGLASISEAAHLFEQRIDALLADPADANINELRVSLSTLSTWTRDLSSKQPARPTGPSRIGQIEPLNPRHIYILEDDKTLGAQLHDILASFHYRPTLFTDSEALIEACRHMRPDALILDLHFGGENAIDGLSIGEAIQREMNPPLPLFATDESQQFDVQLRAVRAGVEGFFSRPLEPIRLAGVLENHLRRHRAPPMRVLIVDDDQAALGYHQLVLETAGFSVITLSEPEETLSTLESFNPDVLVLDVRMPRCSGPELAQIVRYHTRWLQVPIVYLSAVGDAGEQLVAMTKAGDDFLVKPIAPNILLAAVTARARRARMLSMALSRDGLTGLLKHADIKEQLATSLARAQRTGIPLCAAMIDIDHFKSVNDTHGHLVGDDVIHALASLLHRRLRTSDLVSRYGGEEFLAVMHDCELEQATRIFDELRVAFNKFQFLAGQDVFFSSFSAGIIQATAGHDMETLIDDADRRLYVAKRAGRNRVVAAESSELSPTI
ncbi:MAG: diguanylate cyclase [Salinisphaera sp.]|jgi:diguanylate cyclase (GGDEF)-like protein|nr:diguanylate cyclase [Salinisphaera sp.]